MSGLLSRSAVLTASRVSNFAIQLFSPVLLVRILDVAAYGQYQEFMVYATLLTMICAFTFDTSLTYFIPRYPERERALVSQTSVITLVVSVTLLGSLLLARPLLLGFLSYDFVLPLCLYVLFFVNLNWLEAYWIAKRRPRRVLVYSALRLAVRVSVLLLAAYLTRDVMQIIWSMVAVEAVRVVLVLAYFWRRGIFVADMKRSELAEQWRFAAPQGAAAAVRLAGRNLGKIVTSTTLGPAALAYYVAGSYLQPIVRVARSGVEDAVYPELVRAHHTPEGALRLWQRVNVLNCALFFPAFVVLTYYAEEIVTALFTSAYLPAVGVFQVYAFYLLRRVFNTDVLLRTTGRTGFMLWGTVGALAVNLALIFPLAERLGLVGPAIAFIVAEVVLESYYAGRAMRALGLTVARLADWRNIGRIVASCALMLPILLATALLPAPGPVRAAAGSVTYFAACTWVAHRLGVADIGRVAAYVRSRVERLRSAAGAG